MDVRKTCTGGIPHSVQPKSRGQICIVTTKRHLCISADLIECKSLAKSYHLVLRGEGLEGVRGVTDQWAHSYWGP